MKRTGIIDIGSNSMRLSIIQEFAGGGYSVLDEQKSSPRLAGEINPSGDLSARGISELILHLEEFLSLSRSYEVDRLLAIGTAALRMANNRDRICAEVQQALGLRIDIISGEQEALLGFMAVKHTLPVSDALLVDIGGGSTEVTWVREGQLLASRSFPFGAVTVSKWRSPGHAAALTEWLATVRALLAESRLVTDSGPMEIIGIGGTIRNIGQVYQAQHSYPLSQTHNFLMTGAQVQETVAFLADMPLSRRRKTEGLSKDRADLIVPGGAIVLALLQLTKSPSLRISGRGVRDGLFFSSREDATVTTGDDILDASIGSLLSHFGVTKVHAAHVAKLAQTLFEAATAAGLLPTDCNRILRTASLLHRIGAYVSYYHYERHTFYLIVNSAIYGLSHREIVLSAAVAAYNGRSKMRKLCLPYLSMLQEHDLDLAARLGVLVRLAEALDRRHAGCVPHITARFDHERFEIWLPGGCDAQVEVSAMLALGSHVKKVFGRTLTICN